MLSRITHSKVKSLTTVKPLSRVLRYVAVLKIRINCQRFATLRYAYHSFLSAMIALCIIPLVTLKVLSQVASFTSRPTIPLKTQKTLHDCSEGALFVFWVFCR